MIGSLPNRRDTLPGQDSGVSRGGGAGDAPQRLGFLFYSHLIRVR